MRTRFFARSGSAVARFGCALTLLICLPLQAATQAPTPADVEQALKARWDKSATASSPRAALTLNSVKFGKESQATVQQFEVEGVPKGASVTPAIIDFTVRTYYGNETEVVHRVREAAVYKDKMDEWAVMSGSAKGQDTTSTEAAVK